MSKRYIDADALLKTINKNPAEAHNERCAQILEAILYAPTADAVEVRHGEWEDRYKNKYANHYYECSVCGKPALDRTVNNGLENSRQEQALSPFCPNCGTKMDGERKDDGK